jgi:protein-S-isoprenylcysteine O-methyltransferase Ste14
VPFRAKHPSSTAILLEGMKSTITRAGLGTAFTNVALASLFFLFAYAHYQNFARYQRPSGLLMVAAEALFGFFFLTRAPADTTAFSASAWASTIGGTFVPMLLRPVEAPQDALAGQLLQVVGISFATYGILSLNRSIGLLPAHRGIKTMGAYQLVRHPLYVAYAVIAVGYLVSNFTIRNLSIVLVGYACQVLRIFNEERLLSGYPAYLEYKARTRWRLLPYVF